MPLLGAAAAAAGDRQVIQTEVLAQIITAMSVTNSVGAMTRSA